MNSGKGLHVLVVDDDPTSLLTLENMLATFLFKVTKCNRAEIALALLRDNWFNIVISEVHMPGMDGFKLLDIIKREVGIPVIMMSADDGMKAVSVTHGACDYLIKPVRIEDLKNISQHVVVHKTPRNVWTLDQHSRFVAAVNQLGGFEKAVPKQILELMNDPRLTIENIALHLQKYRLHHQRPLLFRSQEPGSSFSSPAFSTKTPFVHKSRTMIIILFISILVHALIHCYMMNF